MESAIVTSLLGFLLTQASLSEAVISPRCLLPHHSGDCDQYVHSYFYDTSIHSCRRFWYGGCGGNANRFETMQLCEEVCHPKRRGGNNTSGAAFLISRPLGRLETTTAKRRTTSNDVIPTSAPDLCDLPRDRGPCVKYTTKWFYNRVKRECSGFWYGGCHGNANRFEDEESCRNRCSTQDC